MEQPQECVGISLRMIMRLIEIIPKLRPQVESKDTTKKEKVKKVGKIGYHI